MKIVGFRSGSFALALCLLMVSLAGCVSERPEPVLIFDEIRYWFEDDLLILNLTVKNIGNFTPGPPDAANPTIWIKLRGRTPLDEAERDELGDAQDLRSRWFESESLFFRKEGGEPFRDRYYAMDAAEAYGFQRIPGFLGPHSFRPNETTSFEFVFLPQDWYDDPDGYYQVDLRIRVTHPETKKQVGQTIISGCFNHDLEEFFGPREDGADCTYYNKEGRRTPIGLSRGEPLGEPAMVHDPPSGVEGAH